MNSRRLNFCARVCEKCARICNAGSSTCRCIISLVKIQNVEMQSLIYNPLNVFARVSFSFHWRMAVFAKIVNLHSFNH